MPFKEHVTVKNIIFILLVLLVFKFMSYITFITLLFFASFVIASSLNPLVDKLANKMNRSLAASIVLFSALIIFFAFFLPIVVLAVKQVKGLIVTLINQVDLVKDFILHHQFYGHRIPELINVDAFITSTSSFATEVFNKSIDFTLGFAQVVLCFLAICMIVFYFMADKDIIKAGLIKLFPMKIKEKASEVYDNISKNVGGYVIAQGLNMVAIGILTAVGMFILKVKYALLLGFITGILDIIPIIGPTIALVLCLIMAYQLGIIKSILVIVVFLAAQWASNNLVRPVIFGKFLNLHPLLIIFSLLVAAQFLGIWGVILAPAIASLICVLFDEIYIKTINRE